MTFQRFSIFDAMERKGVFRSNPANVGAVDSNGESIYRGPVEYPKMMYHPLAEERVVQEAEIIATPMGAKEVNRHTEIIHKIVGTRAEEMEARAEGWTDHPAKSLMAAGKPAPAISPSQRIGDLEARIAELEAEKVRAEELETMIADSNAKLPPKPAATLSPKRA